VEKFYRGINEKFWALKNVNLTIKKGERVGIIGPNGSGKTTLLKIITGITAPTAGKLNINGNVISLIDLEAGFHPDLTGYQNIFLNGMLLGLSKKQVESKISDIIAFADIHQFIDAPLFTYSGGMLMRLGFSIAIHADPDILILDENLSVGDVDFQKKSYQELKDFLSRDKTIVFVSQMKSLIRRYCRRFIIMKNGSIIQDGPISILNNYFDI
jgi:ABC-type polysaccharide/polyol phosphate transport system ATPase subunit